MNAPTRALLMLLAAGATGALLWVAAQLDTQSTDGYYAAHGLIAVGGVLLGLAQLRRAQPRAAGTGRPWLPLLVIAPALLAVLWLIATADPDSNTVRDHLRAWISDLGIAGAVSDIGHWHGALAVGLGLLLGLVALPSLLARRRTEVALPAIAPPARVETPDATSTAEEPVVVEQPVAVPASEPAGPADPADREKEGALRE